MSRSGYVDDPENLGMYRGQVASAIRGKRGQAFLRELAEAMDAMPVKELIASELVTEDGDCCTIGVVCKARALDVSHVDETDPEAVGGLVGIARQLAAEIEYLNDECGEEFVKVPEPKPDDGRWHPGFRWERKLETPAERWVRMRKWVEEQLR